MGKTRKGERKDHGGLPRRVSSSLSPFDLYELCVQSTTHVVPFLRAIHAGDPTILAEDFCGTAAMSREWVKQVRGGRAIAVDHDPKPLARARGHKSVRVIRGDVFTATNPKQHAADIVFVGNFSIGEIHDRRRLVEYLRHCRARLRPGGIFVCDTYGGESAFTIGAVNRLHPGPGDRRTRYTWEQRSADPTTGRVVNAMHFRVDRGGSIELELHDAFVYDWRLWSVPELRDALAEAGFPGTAVYARMPDAVDTDGRAYVEPITDPRDLGPSFIVCVVGRT